MPDVCSSRVRYTVTVETVSVGWHSVAITERSWDSLQPRGEEITCGRGRAGIHVHGLHQVLLGTAVHGLHGELQGISSGLLDVVRLHAVQGPLPAGRPPEEGAQLVDGLAPAGHGAVGAGHGVELLVLCVSQELSALLKSLGVRQVCSRQPTGIP